MLSSGHILLFVRGTLFCLYEEEVIWKNTLKINIHEIIEDNQSNIWFCSERGILKFKTLADLKNSQFEVYLPDNNITNIKEDSKGGFWITTFKKGIFYTNNLQLLNYNRQFGLSSNFISSIAFRKDKEIFIDCGDGNIFQIDRKTDKVLNKFTQPIKLQDSDLFYEKTMDKVWSGATYIKDGKWGNVRFYNPILKKATKLTTKKFLNKHTPAKGKLIGSHGSGFVLIDTKKDSVIYSHEVIRIEGMHTSKLTNQFWIGTADGLFEFKDSQLVATQVIHSAFQNRVETITELSDTTLVFGTKGYGVILWKSDQIIQLTDEEGLVSNMIETVHVDENGVLWIGTLNGLNKVTFDANKKPTIRQFTIETGLPSNEIYEIKSNEEQIWLCTGGGLVRFSEHPENKIAPKPIIQWIKVNDEAIDITQKITFNYQQNNFEIRYLTINYKMNGQIPYRYRLQPANSWKYSPSLNINYPSLPSGNYAFEVQSQNEDGYWSESMTYSFSILSPWWATIWFRALGLLALGLLGYSFYKYRIGQIKRENTFQQEITKLEKSALQAQMNPHFIFNCLNSIQNFILKNDKKKAVEYLSRFATLVRHNLNASVKGLVSLEEEITLLENYLALERERFEQKFDYEINLTEDLKKQFVEFPPMLVQPYVENAVIHGLRKKKGGGQISLDFSCKNSEINVIVRDNGIGYRENEAGNTSARHKSVGMTVTQKRLALLNNQEAVKITTLRDKDNQPIGTQVNIQIKIKNKTI